MLAGKPIIATKNSGGTAELIEEGETGLLYERGNPIELADKIQYLYENPRICIKAGASRLRMGSRSLHPKAICEGNPRYSYAGTVERKKCRHDNLQPLTDRPVQ